MARQRPSSTRRHWPVGSESTRASATAREPDALDDRLDDLGGVVLVARPALADVGRDPDVLAHAQEAEQLEALERAARARAGPASWG